MKDSEISRREMLGVASAAGLAVGMTAGLAGAAQAATSAGTGANAPKASGQKLAGVGRLPDPLAGRMRWAIVGLGNFAVAQMIPRFAQTEHARITAFVSGDPAKAADLGARYGVSKFYNYENFDSIAQDSEIDCVYICLPVGLHAEYTIRALKAGKHVLCEKPMANTPAECRAMIAAAKAANRQLGVAYRVHFDPFNMDIKRRIAAGEIGDIRWVGADNHFNADLAYPPHKWRLSKVLGGGGPMFDYGIYGLNGALMYLGDVAPVDVSAVYTTPPGDPRFAEVEGGLQYRMRMANGAMVHGSTSYYTFSVNRQSLVGTKGAMSMEPANGYDHNFLRLRKAGSADMVVDSISSIPQFAGQIDGFSLAARNNVPHLTPGEMGLRDIVLIDAIYRSADAGGAVVKL